MVIDFSTRNLIDPISFVEIGLQFASSVSLKKSFEIFLEDIFVGPLIPLF